MEKIGLKLRVIDASQDFYNATTKIYHPDGTVTETLKLKETLSPEEKRKIIGEDLGSHHFGAIGCRSELSFLLLFTIENRGHVHDHCTKGDREIGIERR